MIHDINLCIILTYPKSEALGIGMANDNTSIVVLLRFSRPRLEAKKGRPKLMLDEEGGKGNEWEVRYRLKGLVLVEKVQLSIILCILNSSFAAFMQLLY